MYVQSEAHRASAGWGRRAGEGHHLLDGQPQFEAVQRVTDADLPLDLCVGQVGHDGAALDVCTTGGDIPGWHSYPQLGGDTQNEQREIIAGCSSCPVTVLLSMICVTTHTSNQDTTVGPSQDAKGSPWRHASSSNSCLLGKVNVKMSLKMKQQETTQFF